MPPPRVMPMLKWVGDRHLRVSFEDGAARAGMSRADVSDAVRRAVSSVRARPLAGLVDAVAAEATALLTFDGATLVHEAALASVERLLAETGADANALEPRLVEAPVCYGGEHGPDLAEVARRCGLSERQVIDLHAGATYTVEFLGFAPGFGYLSGLPAALVMPRLDSPRPRVAAGSVAIAGERSAVYPLESPGGWRLLGRTPLAMFDPRREPPALLAAGDRVRFVPMSVAEFEAMGKGRPRAWA